MIFLKIIISHHFMLDQVADAFPDPGANKVRRVA